MATSSLSAEQESVLFPLINQIKNGCQKQFCFNKNCKKNTLAPQTNNFSSEGELQVFARQLVVDSGDDCDELLCSDTPTINRNELRNASNEVLTSLIMDAGAFCCSFQEKDTTASEHIGAFAQTFSQDTVMVEESAFAMDDEEEEKNEEDTIAQMRAEEMQKARSIMVEERTLLAEKYKCLNIDTSAVKFYFKSLRSASDNEDAFLDSVALMVEILINEDEQSSDEPLKQLMCTRGLLILSLNERLARDKGQEIATRILATLNKILSKDVTQEKRKVELLSQHAFSVQYLAVMPYKLLLEIVMKFQDLLSNNILQGIINAQLFQECVKVLDIFFWLNFAFKDAQDQIDKKEFTNDAVNGHLDLRAFMDQWANRTKVQVRNGVQITHANQFNPCSYTWLFTPHTKTEMLQRYNELDWKFQADAALMRAFWDPKMRQKRFQGATKFLLEINRESILDDSLQKIVHLKPENGKDALKLPISIRFQNEPGIDEGGVRKEYFLCVIKELLSPGYAMFRYNEDVQLYYFNGQTLEPNIYFELIGNLMGIAVYNNTFIDLPFPRACYKVLIDQEPDLDDLRQWEPETAQSLDTLLSWDDAKMGGKMEDIVLRTFTVDVEVFGAITQKELKENGSNIYVTKNTVKEFVRLYIDFQFKKQCEGQLASFKKGFARVIDMLVVKSLFDYEEIETLICGQRELNFAELRDSAIYAQGYSITDVLIKWLWEIVLEEWSEDKRRKLLTFATGSDRAPVSGLKSLKFYIIKDGEDDDRLPSSHTCFNQLLIPKYSRKEILKNKLQTAIENATGFGMV